MPLYPSSQTLFSPLLGVCVCVATSFSHWQHVLYITQTHSQRKPRRDSGNERLFTNWKTIYSHKSELFSFSEKGISRSDRAETCSALLAPLLLVEYHYLTKLRATSNPHNFVLYARRQTPGHRNETDETQKNASRKCRGIPREKRESKPETKANKVANQVGRNRRQGVCVSRITGLSLQQFHK